jgi:hypothetical protein
MIMCSAPPQMTQTTSLLLFLITVEIAETTFRTTVPMRSLALADSDLHHPSDPAGNHPKLNGRHFSAKAVPIDSSVPTTPTPEILRSSVTASSGHYPSPIGKSANWRFDLHLALETDGLSTPTRSLSPRTTRNPHRYSSS